MFRILLGVILVSVSLPVFAQTLSPLADVAEKISPSELSALEDRIYNKISQVMDEQMHQHRSMFEWGIWIFGILLSIILGGAIWSGYGRIGDVRDELREIVDWSVNDGALNPRIRATVDSELSQRMSEVTAAIERIKNAEAKLKREQSFFAFKSLVRDMDNAETYSKDQLDEAMRYVKEFQAEILEEDAKDTVAILRTLTGKLFRSNRISELKSIEEMFPQLVSSDPIIRNRMIESYTLRIFEHFHTSEDIEKFREYLRAAWEGGYGESALAEELLLLYHPDLKTDDVNAEANRLLDLASDFNGPELGNFLNSFGANTSQDLLSNNPRARHVAIAAAGRQLFDDHWSRLMPLMAKLASENPRGLEQNGVSHLIKLLDEKTTQASTGDDN